MTTEIILIIIGVIFLIGSCLVQEKLTEKDVEQISKLSEEEIKIILEKKINSVKGMIDESINLAIEDSKELTQREMERVSNEKIMAISEYSDTILEAMNKTHNEIMFLYSMLNDKQKDITELVNTIQSLSKKLTTDSVEKKSQQPVVKTNSVASKKSENWVQPNPTIEMTRPQMTAPKYSAAFSESERMLDDAMRKMTEPKVEKEAVAEEHFDMQSEKEPMVGNQNVRILQLHRAGKSDVAIAKELNCGLGEVRLVLGLYKGDNNSEN